MRTSDERMRLIRARSAQRRQRRRRSVRALCALVSLTVILGTGAWMPTLTAQGGMLPAAGTASLLAANSALSYILMGLLSFLLGVCVTALLFLLRRRSERRRDEDDEF